MAQFELNAYVEEIKAISRNSGCTITAAVDRFVLNLDTFNEYNHGTGTINFHVLGHHWGALPAAQKVAQKVALKQALKRSLTETPATIRKTRRR